MESFWTQMERPLWALAPMDDVTDVAFRHTIARYSKAQGARYITWSEFTSADGLVHADEKGQRKLRAKLRFTEIERPVVAQLFSATPKHMEYAARLARELGFDGVDINTGCPDRSVEKQGAGAALIKNSGLVREIVAATKEGAGELPVSVKTRIGYAENELETWLPILLETQPAAITIHARTRNEMSKVPAHWNVLADAVRIRNSFCHSTERQNTMILGNGDVHSMEDAREKVAASGVDGAMLGRAMFGNPWVMSDYQPTLEEKLQALIEHTELFEQEFSGIKSFAVMRKHFASYVEGFPGAKELRVQLMTCDSAHAVRTVLEGHLH